MKEQNNLLRVDRKLTPEVKESLRTLSLIEEFYELAIQKISVSETYPLGGLSETLGSLAKEEKNFQVAGFILHGLKNNLDREIPYNALSPLKESYTHLQRLCNSHTSGELLRITPEVSNSLQIH